MSFSFFQRKDKQQETAIRSEDKASDAIALESDEARVLTMDNIRLGMKNAGKEEAIRMAGQILVEGGYVEPGYVAAMLEREEALTTYIGDGIAIPHGVGTARDLIVKSGICILQFPEGVSFGEGNVAHLVVGIAGKGGEHMEILMNLAEIMQDTDIVKELFKTTDKQKVFDKFCK